MEKPKGVNFKDNNTKPRGRRSAPKSEERMTGKNDPYAYIFKDPTLGELKVLNSSNAWWLDSVKLQKLIDSYKLYATDDQACFYAGITTNQLEYFQKLHPDFYGIKHACKQYPNLSAKKKVVGDIEKSTETAKWWLERTEKDTFSTRQEQTAKDGQPLFPQGNVIKFEDFGEGKKEPPKPAEKPKPEPEKKNPPEVNKEKNNGDTKPNQPKPSNPDGQPKV